MCSGGMASNPATAQNEAPAEWATPIAGAEETSPRGLWPQARSWWAEFSLQTKLLAVATLVVSLMMTGITFFALNGIQRDAVMNDTRYARDLGLLLAGCTLLFAVSFGTWGRVARGGEAGPWYEDPFSYFALACAALGAPLRRVRGGFGRLGGTLGRWGGFRAAPASRSWRGPAPGWGRDNRARSNRDSPIRAAARQNGSAPRAGSPARCHPDRPPAWPRADNAQSACRARPCPAPTAASARPR